MEDNPPTPPGVDPGPNDVVTSNVFEDHDNNEPDVVDDSSPKTLREVALEVLEGKWGVGQDKRAALAEAGFDHNEVHEETVKILNENR